MYCMIIHLNRYLTHKYGYGQLNKNILIQKKIKKILKYVSLHACKKYMFCQIKLHFDFSTCWSLLTTDYKTLFVYPDTKFVIRRRPYKIYITYMYVNEQRNELNRLSIYTD